MLLEDVFKIYSGIANALKENFKDIIRVNKIDEAKARESSFFYLQLVDSSFKRELNNRVNKDLKIQILYYSSKDEPNLDYAIMVDKLYDIFDSIIYEGHKYKVSEKSCEMSKDGLAVLLQFKNIWSINKSDGSYMKKLEGETKIKK